MGTITVTGSGSIHVVPDVTRIETNITGVFKTYEEAYAQAKENSSWMVKILEYNHKSGKLAKTTSLDITDHTVPQYDEDGNYIESIKQGYDMVQRIKVDIGIDNVLLNNLVRGIGKFIKGAQINIGYTIQDPRPHQLKMLERAIHDATEKANIMVKAAGCKLGEVSSINYSHHDVHMYAQARNIHSNKEAMASSPEALDITPDDLVISDEVMVIWDIEQA